MVTETSAQLVDPGRCVEKDLRDLDYLLAVHNPAVGRDPRSFGCVLGGAVGLLIHNQTSTPLSVACALSSALESQRALVDPKLLHQHARNDHDLLSPISLRAGCRVLKRSGIIDAYHWTYEVDEIASYLLQLGPPLVCATDWYDWMYHPDAESGVLKRPHGTAARLVGGAAFVLYGVDMAANLAEVGLSFGRDWGGWSAGGQRRHGGCARLPLDELRRLLKGNGEAVALSTLDPC